MYILDKKNIKQNVEKNELTFNHKSGLIIFDCNKKKLGTILLSNDSANKMFGYKSLKNMNCSQLSIEISNKFQKDQLLSFIQTGDNDFLFKECRMI